MEFLENGYISINADFELGNLDLWTVKSELERLLNGGNMDRLTEDHYKKY